jgi:hypothetical protein
LRFVFPVTSVFSVVNNPEPDATPLFGEPPLKSSDSGVALFAGDAGTAIVG